jgi:undecaprenyl-diphosphatase
MIAGYYIGIWGIVAVGVLLALYFLYKRFWCELVMTAVSLSLSGVIFLILSHIFMRPRPWLLFDNPIWLGSKDIPGFPSGHAKSILLLCGLLVYLLLPRIKSYLGKVMVISIALFMVAYIGFSRLFVGDHYLTDVIAGYAVGIAWFSLVYTSIEWLFQRYAKKSVKS